MIIDVLTIFPNMLDAYLQESIIKRALEDEKIEINVRNIRNYSKLKHHQVDDTIYGGGAGMLLMFPPFYDAIADLKKADTHIILTTPKGKTLNQKQVESLSKKKHLIILCGHYEGIDSRIDDLVDEQISIGDYVLTGGELAALVLIDSITRLQEGVINASSHLDDTFSENLLEYPQYTKPQVYEGYEVPEVLLSGHHDNIAYYRRYQSIKETYLKRPDLLKDLSSKDLEILNKVKEELK
ncbi:MAG: tRNA (guanosine(37)-N1)-methyltransferase TrmD [Acholeplasmataceae bacterium]